MTLVVDWSNLGLVAFPFLLSITTATLLALLLRRAAELSGLPRSREVCVGCVHEPALLRDGYCRQNCVINSLPSTPLVLFIGSATFALLTAFFPDVVLTYILPFGFTNSEIPGILEGLLLVSAGGASVTIAGYFAQDLAAHRELLNRVALLIALAGLIVGAGTSGAVSQTAETLVPLGLGMLLVGLAIEWRARRGRPTLGLRALGFSATPLFVIAVLALIRIAQILALANASS